MARTLVKRLLQLPLQLALASLFDAPRDSQPDHANCSTSPSGRGRIADTADRQPAGDGLVRTLVRDIDAGDASVVQLPRGSALERRYRVVSEKLEVGTEPSSAHIALEVRLRAQSWAPVNQIPLSYLTLTAGVLWTATTACTCYWTERRRHLLTSKNYRAPEGDPYRADPPGMLPTAPLGSAGGCFDLRN